MFLCSVAAPAHWSRASGERLLALCYKDKHQLPAAPEFQLWDV
jgi:hypothetical protein